MELVYLWIKDYKNIKEQGFNFSPRFECRFYDEYDDDGKLKENCKLDIREKKDYVSIFPENINVTAIVGENGSGKSNIFEKMLNLFAEKYDDDYKNFICLYIYDKELYQYSNIQKEKLHSLVNVCTSEHILPWHNDLIALYINNQYETIEGRDSEQLFTENSKYSKNYINKILISNYLKNRPFNQATQKFFNPTKVIIKINDDNFFNPILNEDRVYYKDNIWENIDKEKSKLKDSTFFNKLKTIEKIFNIKKNSHDEVSSITIFNDEKDKSYFNRKYTIKENFTSNIPKIIQDDTSINNNFEIIISDITSEIFLFIENLPYVFDIIVKDNDKSFNDLSYGERQLLVQLNFILFYLHQNEYEMHCTYYDENGGGEEGYETKTINKIIVLLDEFELGLHPNWQKKFVSYIIDFFEDIKKDISIIIATHSPFLLSDLPKENVIFLDKYKKEDEEVKSELQKVGNCKNVSKIIDIQTFGANIHTLLSHGFFMQDGLMGEFAKSKINEIIDFHKKIEENEINQNELEKVQKRFEHKKEYKDKKEHFNHIESIIGEDYLKQVIKNHIVEIEKTLYKDKYIDSKIEKVKQELKRLEAIKNAKN